MTMTGYRPFAASKTLVNCDEPAEEEGLEQLKVEEELSN